MKVHIITIGDEILIGQIVDTNSAWMGTQLNEIGAAVTRITSVGDGAADISMALAEALDQADIVLITGGLGPTKDDITKKVIADFFGSELVFHQPTYDRLEGLLQNFGRTPTPAHRAQCLLPTNATILTNKMGTAPGMWFDYQGKVIVSMPGVPYEMQYLMSREVIPRLKTGFSGRPIFHLTLRTAGEGESVIAERVEDIEAELPPHIKLAYLPGLAQVRLRLSGSAPDAALLKIEVESYGRLIQERLGDLIYARNEESLEAAVGRMLLERGLSLATAESCTGGYVAHMITSIPGSSAYFKGSVVAYANEIKEAVLGVKTATLETQGAVSEATVREMVQGVLRVMQTDLAVAISGIAGPGGGSPEKPVGTIWFAVGNASETIAFKIQSGKDRLKNIEYAGSVALNLVRKFVLQYYPEVVTAEVPGQI